jgi:hypothetical protein
VLSVLLRYTDSDYPFGISKFFYTPNKDIFVYLCGILISLPVVVFFIWIIPQCRKPIIPQCRKPIIPPCRKPIISQCRKPIISPVSKTYHSPVLKTYHFPSVENLSFPQCRKLIIPQCRKPIISPVSKTYHSPVLKTYHSPVSKTSSVVCVFPCIYFKQKCTVTSKSYLTHHICVNGLVIVV